MFVKRGIGADVAIAARIKHEVFRKGRVAFAQDLPEAAEEVGGELHGFRRDGFEADAVLCEVGFGVADKFNHAAVGGFTVGAEGEEAVVFEKDALAVGMLVV